MWTAAYPQQRTATLSGLTSLITWRVCAGVCVSSRTEVGQQYWYQPLTILLLDGFAMRSRARRDRPRGLLKPLSQFETVHTDTPSFWANFSCDRLRRVRSLTTSCFRSIIPSCRENISHLGAKLNTLIAFEYNEGLRKVNILLIGSQTFRYSALRHKPFSQTVRELSESFEGLVST